MKPPTVFLGEMTSPEVEVFLGEHDTVIVPVGSTEQHGPHGPLLTDAIVPTEVARRVAPEVDAVVAPTFMAFIEDVVAGLADVGFRRIVLLNGHYDNTYALAYACANVADRLPEGTRAFPLNYWDGITADEAAEFFGATSGLHANKGETSAVLAINPALVDMDAANAEMPPFPTVGNAPAVHTAFFFSAPGSVHRATASGTWGDARDANSEFGQRYLEAVTRGTKRMLGDIERTFEAMPSR